MSLGIRYIPQGCVLYLPFLEASGRYCRDVSGRNNDGIAYGTTILDVGKFKARSFNGVDDYVHIPYSISLYPNVWTFMCWINRFTSAGASERVLSYSNEVTRDRWIRISATNTLESGFYDTGGVSRYVITEETIPLNIWKHIIATFDGTYIRVYIDGVLKATSDDFSACTPRNQNLYVWLGRLEDTYRFNGIIDEVQIYNRALSQAEITALFNSLRRRFGV